MLKIMLKKWDENQELLKTRIGEIEDISDLDYFDLVKLTFSTIYNNGEQLDSVCDLDIDNITEIDNGDYQGTLLYLIPFDRYQPSETEYLITYVGYGSCSGCDTLQAIRSYNRGKANDEQIQDLLLLCKDIITNTVKPYNYGWRYSELFEPVTDSE